MYHSVVYWISCIYHVTRLGTPCQRYIHGNIPLTRFAGSGSIDFPEFLKLTTTKLHQVDTEEELLEAFKVHYDRGNDVIVIVISTNC